MVSENEQFGLLKLNTAAALYMLRQLIIFSLLPISDIHSIYVLFHLPQFAAKKKLIIMKYREKICIYCT